MQGSFPFNIIGILSSVVWERSFTASAMHEHTLFCLCCFDSVRQAQSLRSSLTIGSVSRVSSPILPLPTGQNKQTTTGVPAGTIANTAARQQVKSPFICMWHHSSKATQAAPYKNMATGSIMHNLAAILSWKPGLFNWQHQTTEAPCPI